MCYWVETFECHSPSRRHLQEKLKLHTPHHYKNSLCRLTVNGEEGKCCVRVYMLLVPSSVPWKKNWRKKIKNYNKSANKRRVTHEGGKSGRSLNLINFRRHKLKAYHISSKTGKDGMSQRKWNWMIFHPQQWMEWNIFIFFNHPFLASNQFQWIGWCGICGLNFLRDYFGAWGEFSGFRWRLKKCLCDFRNFLLKFT